MADAAAPGVDPERLVGERIAGRFVVERLIGQGPLSTAFRAHDDRLHRRVTVKLFHPRHHDDVHVVQSQLAAARAVARLSHEHLAMVIDQGEHEGMPLVVLEYVRGENLAERIDRYAPLAVPEVARHGLQIARALTYAHGQGVVHGNIRPENVLLTEEREVKLVDFGGGSYVAQLVGDPYAAPELREVDPGAPAQPGDDIYALGALLFVALTEQSPRPDIDGAEVQMLRPDLSPRLAATIARTLAGDPERRHASMRELAAELSTAQEGALHAGREDAPRAFGAVVASAETREFNVLGAGDAAADGDEDTARGAVRPVRAPKRRSRSSHERRARLLAWSMVLVPIVALVVVGLMIAGERSEEPVTKPETKAAGPVGVIPIVSAVSMDPRPAGDGSEHADTVANAIDDDPETTWETEGYDTPTFAGLKPGVGLVLELGTPADVRDVEIATRLTGWRVQVYAAATPQPTLAGWTPVSEPTDVRDGTKVAVDTSDLKLAGVEPGRTPTLLLWVTKLALDVDDPSTNRARLSEVRVYAAAAATATAAAE